MLVSFDYSLVCLSVYLSVCLSVQARVVPPWVEEHPDVFTDPSFSITQLDSSCGSAMEVSRGGPVLARVKALIIHVALRLPFLAPSTASQS